MKRLSLFLLLCLLSSSCFSETELNRYKRIVKEISIELPILKQALSEAKTETNLSKNLLNEMTNCRNSALIVINEQEQQLIELRSQSEDLTKSLKKQTIFDQLFAFFTGFFVASSLGTILYLFNT